jgi:hypothetical protein
MSNLTTTNSPKHGLLSSRDYFTSLVVNFEEVGTEDFSPSAMLGNYVQFETGDWSYTYTGFFSRLDLLAAVGENLASGLNGGRIQTSVKVRGVDGTMVPATEYNRLVSTFFDGKEKFFYDFELDSQGNNICQLLLFQGPFDEYEVTLTPAGVDPEDTGATECIYRLNGITEFDRDPTQTFLPELSTVEGVLDLTPKSNEKDRRNQVIVVGARKATVSDSTKFLKEQQQQNPNNPLPEYFVSVSVDPYGLYDGDSPRFSGGKETTVIVDDKVSDGDFARWLSRLVLYRHLAPKLAGSVEHTAIPVLEVRDAIQIEDARDAGFPHLLWVTAFSESWKVGSAHTAMELSSYPELPSYTPREDLDLDSVGGRAVGNISVTYQNIYGEDLSVEDLHPDIVIPEVTYVEEAISLDGSSRHTTQTGVVEDSFSFVQYAGADTQPQKVLVNNPYRRFWHVDSWTSGGAARMKVDFQEGDGTAGVYDTTYYGFPTASPTWKARYAKMGTRTGANPFYDPYTSEVGNLVKLGFDTRVAGLYRISIWGVSDTSDFDRPVAWLTSPEGEPNDPDTHWLYYDAGTARELYWDGTDNVGTWNRFQSDSYAKRHQGAFGDKPMAVGKGYYAWNDQRTPLQAQIGDIQVENMQYDADGNPLGFYFTMGKYARFYVKFEVQSDSLLRETGDRTPLEVNTAVQSDSNPNGLPDTEADPAFYVWTHLGEPTQVHVQAYEWNEDVNSAGPWTPFNLSDGWEKISTAESGAHEFAAIRMDKPVKFVFSPVARKGLLFRKSSSTESDPDKISVQRTRQAHLKATVFDQFFTFFGTDWKEAKQRGIEEKRLTSRMYHDENHTLEWTDDTWRTGDDLPFLEWVFDPSQFEKDFGSGEESLRYGDYAQLETIPGHDPKRAGGTSRADRSHLMYAYINYVFYFSVFVFDRSGRRQWCIDPEFIDKSKIVTPTWLALTYSDTWNDPTTGMKQYALRYPTLGADEYLVRSIFARQWLEPDWSTGDYNGSPVDEFTITDVHQLAFVQPEIRDFHYTSGVFNDATLDTATLNYWFKAYTNVASNASKDINNKILSGSRTTPLPAAAFSSTATYHQCPAAFGVWDFERGGYGLLYKPCPSMDFQPYWNKFMPDYNARYPYKFTDVDVLSATGSMRFRAYRDVSAQDTWHGWAESHEYMIDNGTSWMTNAGARLEDTGQRFLHDDNRGSQANTLFDYQKVDTLDRFDQFRGVISRGELRDRDEADAAYWDNDKDRVAPAQAVKASGVYLLNVAKYDDYIVGAIHESRRDIIIHSAEKITDFFDIRFRYEYAWYNDRHFPIYDLGGTAYHRYRSDYTKANAKVLNNNPRVDTTETYYDPGAWTGWKDDRTSAEWTANPFLRWAEFASPLLNQDTAYAKINILGILRKSNTREGRSNATAVPCGGYSSSHVTTAFASTGLAIGERRYQSNGSGSDADSPKKFQRQNIFEGPSGEIFANYMRLAVGPEVPEAARLVMNLTLPSSLT